MRIYVLSQTIPEKNIYSTSIIYEKIPQRDKEKKWILLKKKSLSLSYFLILRKYGNIFSILFISI